MASETRAARATDGMVISAPSRARSCTARTMAARVRAFWFTRPAPWFTGAAPWFTRPAPWFTGAAPWFTGPAPWFTGAAPWGARPGLGAAGSVAAARELVVMS